MQPSFYQVIIISAVLLQSRTEETTATTVTRTTTTKSPLLCRDVSTNDKAEGCPIHFNLYVVTLLDPVPAKNELDEYYSTYKKLTDACVEAEQSSSISSTITLLVYEGDKPTPMKHFPATYDEYNRMFYFNYAEERIKESKHIIAQMLGLVFQKHPHEQNVVYFFINFNCENIEKGISLLLKEFQSFAGDDTRDGYNAVFRFFWLNETTKNFDCGMANLTQRTNGMADYVTGPLSQFHSSSFEQKFAMCPQPKPAPSPEMKTTATTTTQRGTETLPTPTIPTRTNNSLLCGDVSTNDKAEGCPRHFNLYVVTLLDPVPAKNELDEYYSTYKKLTDACVEAEQSSSISSTITLLVYEGDKPTPMKHFPATYDEYNRMFYFNYAEERIKESKHIIDQMLGLVFQKHPNEQNVVYFFINFNCETIEKGIPLLLRQFKSFADDDTREGYNGVFRFFWLNETAKNFDCGMANLTQRTNGMADYVTGPLSQFHSPSFEQKFAMCPQPKPSPSPEMKTTATTATQRITQFYTHHSSDINHSVIYGSLIYLLLSIHIQLFDN